MERVTLNLNDRIEEIEDRVADLRDEQDAIEDEAADVDSDEELAALREEYRDLERDIRALENTAETMEQKVDEWGGSEFVIEEFSFGDQANANDLVLQDMNREGKQAVEEAYNARKIRIVQVGVQQTPPNAPDHPNQYPPAVGEWLYESIEELNTYGEVGLNDFSLPSTLTEP